MKHSFQVMMDNISNKVRAGWDCDQIMLRSWSILWSLTGTLNHVASSPKLNKEFESSLRLSLFDHKHDKYE